MNIPYSGYFFGGKIFVSSEFLASSWKNFRGHGILNHTQYYVVLFRGKNFMVRLSSPKTMKILPPDIRYYAGSLTLCGGSI